MKKASIIDRLPAFLQACIRGYKGRVCRRDYWLMYGAYALALALTVLLFVGFISTGLGDAMEAEDIEIFMNITALLFFIPVALSHIGRLHDLGYSGWWLLLLAVPFLNLLLWAVIAFFPSAKEENKWGKKPE